MTTRRQLTGQSFGAEPQVSWIDRRGNVPSPVARACKSAPTATEECRAAVLQVAFMYSISVPSITDEQKDRWKVDARTAGEGKFDTSNNTGELPWDPNGRISEREETSGSF